MISSFSTKLLLPRVVFTIAASVTPFVSAKAHIGHVSDMAGHDHNAGISLFAASVVLAGWLATREDGENLADQDDTDGAETGDEING